MAANPKFSKGTTINVAVPSNLTYEQTARVLQGVLKVVGHPTCFSGYKIQFNDEAEAVGAHITVDKQLNVSAVN